MVKAQVPERGDIIYLNFSPTRGHEQKGFRPGLVVSRGILNKASGLALVVPITTHEKGYPFEVSIESAKVSGVALVDQVRSIDWQARSIKIVGRANPTTVDEVRAKLATMLM